MRSIFRLILLILLAACESNPVLSNAQPWVPLNRELPTHVPVLAVAVNPKHPDAAYAATYDNVGIYRSEKPWNDWQPDRTGLPEAPVFALATDDDKIFVGSAAGLFQRDADATNWTPVDSIPTVAVYALVRGSNNTLFAGTDGQGIYLRANASAPWSRLPGLEGEIISSVLPLDDQTIFAGTSGHGLFVSRDAGQTWSALKQFANKYVPLLASDPGDARTVYVGPRGGVFRSRDAGLTWEALGGGIENENVYGLLVSVASHKLFAATAAHGVFLSQDNGATWQSAREPDGGNPFTPGQAVLSLAAFDRYMLLGTTDGVIHSDDYGTSWFPHDPNQRAIGVPNIHDMSFDAKSGILWAATEDGLYNNVSPGLWQRAGTGEIDAPVLSVAIAPGNPNRIYIGTSGKGVFVSDDGGKSWGAAGGELGGRLRVPGLAIDPQNPENVFARILFERIFKTSDGGDNWHTVWPGMSDETEVESIAIAPSDPKIVYAGTNQQLSYSNDGGETWQPRGLQSISTLSLWIDPNDATKVLAGATDGLYQSDDAGLTWTGPLLNHTTITAIARDARGKFYLGTKYNGIFAGRETNPREFTNLGKGLEHSSVVALTINDQAGVIYAATTEGMYCTLIDPAKYFTGSSGASVFC